VSHRFASAPARFFAPRGLFGSFRAMYVDVLRLGLLRAKRPALSVAVAGFVL
jgi:hypothetical protein